MADCWEDLDLMVETLKNGMRSSLSSKAYVGVIAPPILIAMDRVEPMTDPILLDTLSEADKNIARNLSFLLAQVLSGPPLQLMMNTGEQNGLEAWRLLVRSEQPVTGANRIAAMQAILQYKFSPGFDRLEEELRTFEGLVKTYRAIFGEEISDSITQAIVKSQMPTEIRPHLELQTFARTAEIISLMSSLSKMRTASTGSNAVSNGPVPMEIGWVNKKGKGKGKGKDKGKEKGKSKEKGKGKKQDQIQSGAAAVSSNSSQASVSTNNVGAKEIGLIESVQEDSEMGWLFMIADAMTINQLSMDGAHSLVVDSGAYVHVCPKSYATHATLQPLPERRRGLDLRSASGKMLKVWGLREVAYNALDLHGKVFTVKIPFVVCAVRRPLLSLAMLEDKGFHMTVHDGCRKLGGHGREMNLRRQGNSYFVDVEFRGGLLEKRKEIGLPPGLVALVDSDVVGLSATAVEDERRAVTISTPETPSREAVESHLLTHIPFAPWCRACIAGRGRESPHFRQIREEPVATPVISLDYFFLGLSDSTGDGIMPTLAMCDGNTTYSLGLMVPKKGPVPYAVRGVCVSARAGLHSHGSQK